MAAKRAVSFRVNEALATKFEAATKLFYEKKGLCFGAALLMFLQAHPAEQGDYVNQAFQLDTEQDVARILDAVKAEQLRRIETGETHRADRPAGRARKPRS